MPFRVSWTAINSLEVMYSVLHIQSIVVSILLKSGLQQRARLMLHSRSLINLLSSVQF